MLSRLFQLLPVKVRHSLRTSPSLGALVGSAAVAEGRRRANDLFPVDGRVSAQGRPQAPVVASGNPLEAYFDARSEGRGIWKWRHYFDIYHRHFQKFIGRQVNFLEVGVYSGGSLDLWRDYFGPGCRIFGVDIEPTCKAYEDESVKIFIGDQSDRGLWRALRQEIPSLDIVLDDGGHHPDQQIVTLEETLPYMRPGGVYVCEDVMGAPHRFAEYVSGVASGLNDSASLAHNLSDPERRLVVKATPLQSAVHSIHVYPYVVVIERTDAPVSEFVAPKHGSQWQPFLK